MMYEVWREVRHAVRTLCREPGFALIATLSLALGIGATTGVFSVVNGVLLKPLPFDEQDELVAVWQTAPGVGLDEVNLSGAMSLTYRDENRVFEDLAFWQRESATIVGLSEPEQVWAIGVSAGLLPLLRVPPLIGRGLTAEDDAPGAPHTVMLSYGYWQREFASDPESVGRTLRVDGVPREVIGVLPPAFGLPRANASIYVPIQLDRASLSASWEYQAIGRLSPGVTVEEAAADVARMIPMVPERLPGTIGPATIEQTRLAPNLRPLKQDFVGDVGEILWVLLSMVGIVLLISCAIVANLTLARAEVRQQEVAIRMAMGARPTQIAGQRLIESLVLGLCGGLAGVGLAFGGVGLLTWMDPEGLPRLQQISLDPTTLSFTLGISILSGLVVGLIPIIRVGGMDPAASIREGGRGAGTSLERHRARKTLVVTQMSLALVLLVGSGLMIRSFHALQGVAPGFANPAEVLTFGVPIPEAEVESDDETLLAYEEIWRRLHEVPGVVSVGASTTVTMGGGSSSRNVLVEDLAVPAVTRVKWVSGGYLGTMQNPVLAGRSIEWPDVHDRVPVAVVTANFAEVYWGSPPAAIGKRIATSPERWLEIVGVSGNVHDDGVSQAAPPVVFLPLSDKSSAPRGLAFAIRTSDPSAASLLPGARAAVAAVNTNLPLANVRTLDEILDHSMAQTSFMLIILTIAAAVALALGGVGVYGVTSYLVVQRTREIGVRMALGANPRDVRYMIVKQGMVLAGISVAIGLFSAVGLSHLMSSLLFGVEATDPLTLAVVPIVLSLVASVASYLPARRASQTDPIRALRFG
jgi:predicted permease